MTGPPPDPRRPERRDGTVAGFDWLDAGGLLALAAVTVGAYIQWGLGVALLVFGGVLGLVILRIIFPRG